MNDYFRVYTSGDVVGVELAAALKNVIALCAGCTDGMGCGDNTKALLMTRGLAEMARAGCGAGWPKGDFYWSGWSRRPDRHLHSMHSRNRRYGILIGQGKSVPEALEEIGAVVEAITLPPTPVLWPRRPG